MKSHAGNVLFLILIAVALFAGLGYAVTSSVSTAPGKVEDEKQKLDQAVLNNCESAINLALLRLRNMGGCADDEINYELPDGSNANPNAPVDGHCNVFHPAYGGASPCGITSDPSCDLTTLSIGESCGAIVYAGESGGNRIYTTRADHSNGIAWIAGSGNDIVTTATDQNDGVANTDYLITLVDADSPYLAAQLCRSYGEEWYLPATNELILLYNNRDAIGGFNQTGAMPEGHYWASSDFSIYSARRIRFSDGQNHVWYKESLFAVRCVRRD